MDILFKNDLSKIITTFQAMYYRAKQAELSAEIADIEKYSNSVNWQENMKVTAVEKLLVKIIYGRSHTMYWLSIRLY